MHLKAGVKSSRATANDFWVHNLAPSYADISERSCDALS